MSLLCGWCQQGFERSFRRQGRKMVKNATQKFCSRDCKSKFNNDKQLRRTYGISLADAEAIKAVQDGKCAICRRLPDRLVIDHDHASGKVRAALCDRCNTCLWLLEGAAPEWFMLAQAYLRKHSTNAVPKEG